MNIESVSSGAGAVLTGGSPLEGAPAPDITVVGPSADLVAPVSSFDAPAAVLVAGVMPQVIAEPVLTNDGAMRIGVGGVLTVQPQVINITGNDQTIDKTLKPNTVSTIDIGGSGNKVDYAGDPKPVIGAQANAILGGKNNSGEIDAADAARCAAQSKRGRRRRRPDSPAFLRLRKRASRRTGPMRNVANTHRFGAATLLPRFKNTTAKFDLLAFHQG